MELEFEELVALMLEGRLSEEERRVLIEILTRDKDKAEFVRSLIQSYPEMEPELKKIRLPGAERGLLDRVKSLVHVFSYRRLLIPAFATVVLVLVVVTGTLLKKEQRPVKKHFPTKEFRIDTMRVDTTDTLSRDTTRADSLRSEFQNWR